MRADRVLRRCLADFDLTADADQTLAADYDWLFDDDVLADGGAINQPAAARAAADRPHQRGAGRGLRHRHRCGGARAPGFHRGAADGSDAMAGAAAARFRRERLSIPLLRCRWADLPAATAERFDVVLCTGNALVHAACRDAMVRALTGLRRMARPGERVAVDSRNWEKLHAERQIVQIADRVVTGGGRRCWAFYAWKVPIASATSTSPIWCSPSTTAARLSHTNM